MTDDDDNDTLRRMGSYITLPFVLAIPPILGWLIGHYLDKRWNTDPYLSYFLLFLGFAAGAREFYRIIKKYGNQ